MNIFTHTVSVFPDLLTFGLLAPAILRATIAIIGIMAGWSVYKKSEKLSDKLYSLPYFITGIFLIIGMYTQVFAIVGIAMVVLNNYVNIGIENVSGERRVFQVLICVILISLLFTGPGFMAIDYPL